MEKAPNNAVGGCNPKHDDSDDENANLTKKPANKKILNPTCCKCKEKGNYNFKNGIILCASCFKAGIVEQRFKASLRKYVNIKGKNKNQFYVLLSGGCSSTCQAKVVSESLKPGPTGRKMFYDAKQIHVDESIFYYDLEDLDGKAREQKNLEKVKDFAQDIGLELHVIDLVDFFNKENVVLKDLISSLKDAGSCREDFIRNFRRIAIHNFCKENSVTKLLQGDNGDSLAVSAFTSLIKGKGYEMYNEGSYLTTFMDDENILLCRPQKDITQKDMYYYNKITKIENHVIDRTNLCLGVKGKSSVLPGRGNFDALIGNFLQNLQRDFNSTIPTVLATTEKLVKPVSLPEKCRVCGLCLDHELNVLECAGNDWLCCEYVDISDGLEMKKDSNLIDKFKAEELKGLCFGCIKIMENCSDAKKTNDLILNLFENCNEAKNTEEQKQPQIEEVKNNIEIVQKVDL